VNPLQRLHDAGVSIWLDTLSRELLETGDFERLVRECAVTGATSNPTIFAKAITGSDRYDDQLRAAVAAGIRDPRELFFELALDDVRRAADLLRPTYQASDGRDGFVSFECTPDLADHTDATIAQALDLWGRLDRPNVMIKVPATPTCSTSKTSSLPTSSTRCPKTPCAHSPTTGTPPAAPTTAPPP
jgi:transaldolase